MIGWGVIGFGAVLSAIVAAAAVALAARQDRLRAAAGAAIGAGLGPPAWNAILRATHGTTFFTDAPVAILPASWQDTGSGVFAVALTALVLGLVLLPDRPARPVVAWSVLAGVAAFLVDVYLY